MIPQRDKETMTLFTIGQRWISKMEPELGMGSLSDISKKIIEISFAASGVTRLYSVQSAPLIRVQYAVGDTIITRENQRIQVEGIDLKEGLFYYRGKEAIVSETELSDSISFSTPKSRLMAGLFDTSRKFNLRYSLQEMLSFHMRSPAFGFTGGRVDLIPHQFYIASEVSGRFSPRVLLSDETGLGKTIEAGLILHRLILSERLRRVLILVPESLVHQWFVELYRRFNLIFTIGNRDYLNSFQHLPDINPFFENQQFIVSFKRMAIDKSAFHQIQNVSWDMVVVDEAHHLRRSTRIHELVAKLAFSVKGMMLLTATPEQFGSQSHFEHLSLLDPFKYHDYPSYKDESKEYRRTAETISRIIGNGSDVLDPETERDIKGMLEKSGPGRIIFRNTRKVMKTFPSRIGKLHPLTGSMDDILRAGYEWLLDEEKEERRDSIDLSSDPRLIWLESFLREQKGEKVLLISRNVSKAIAIEDALKSKISVPIAQFNETMSIVQRDRNAAFFSEKNGAAILICSEIGSEGRNFQFARHLVMFDLPFNSELIEQRIGRLDRIGQTHDIHIHVPYIRGSVQEIFARWVDEGIDLLNRHVNGLYRIFDIFKDRLERLMHFSIQKKELPPHALDDLILETRQEREKMEEFLSKGRDRLIEFNSFNRDAADKLLHHIRQADEDIRTDQLILDLLENFGIETDPIGDRTHLMTFHQMKSCSFPVPPLRKDGMAVTFNRSLAMTRQEIDFLTLDHPLVMASIELFLGSETGNTSLCAMKGGPPAILLETVHAVECISPKALHMGRFMPKTPIRTVIDHSGKDVTEKFPLSLLEEELTDLNPSWLKNHYEHFSALLQKMLAASEEISKKKVNLLIKEGLRQIDGVLGDELSRLNSLKEINPAIRDEEINACSAEWRELSVHIAQTGIRLDAIRLIRKGTF